MWLWLTKRRSIHQPQGQWSLAMSKLLSLASSGLAACSAFLIDPGTQARAFLGLVGCNYESKYGSKLEAETACNKCKETIKPLQSPQCHLEVETNQLLGLTYAFEVNQSWKDYKSVKHFRY